ncbi:MAG: phosphotransferase [Anaerolineales bacterium]|nr:phosphotransferase [Anaerolineales bacterium]
MNARPRQLLALLAGLGALWLAGCTPTAQTPAATAIPAVTEALVGTPPPRTQPPAATEVTALTATPTVPASTAGPTAASTAYVVVEARVVEVEWPPVMRLGDSDVIRLAVLPASDVLTVTTEFADHTTITETLPIPRLTGFDLAGVARLDAVGFASAPNGDQAQSIRPGQPITWRWTLRPLSAGRHRLALSLRLRWLPRPSSPQAAAEVNLYDRGLTIEVQSLLGLTTRELVAVGLTGLVVGSTLSLPLAAHALRPHGARSALQILAPNPIVSIEKPPDLRLSASENDVLRALFKAYGRLVVSAEFRSGYSGARTFLAQPIRSDGRADAYTIAKLGERAAIEREFHNYETFVKDTLPPITARIQSRPVTLGRRPGAAAAPALAALRYTFIGEPGQSPTSLRAALLADPDPGLLDKVFTTFGPNWWMQRRPYTFRLAYEYDRLLPAHFVLEPVHGVQATQVLDGRLAPAQVELARGGVVKLQHLRPAELRADGQSWSLIGTPPPGQPPLRVRWLDASSPATPAARVVATRATLLADAVRGLEVGSLPTPFARLPDLLNERISGTQSTCHGDLNLENILVGPGGFVWLIDFAQTRDAHTLLDFACLEAALIAQVLETSGPAGSQSYARLAAGVHPLQAPIRAFAARCLYDPNQPREYLLALTLTCLGSLKFVNLNRPQKERLFLTATALIQMLDA